jgi:hypothetical protein
MATTQEHPPAHNSRATVIGVLVDPNDAITADSEAHDMRMAARSVGQRIEIVQAGSARDIETVFAKLGGMQVGALW